MNKQTQIIFSRVIFAAALVLAPLHLRAADVYFFESFENYKLGPLDANLPAASGGVNAARDGAYSTSPGVFFNPWWGSEPPNLVVVGAENGVTPHSGSKMVRSVSTNETAFSQDLYNLGYRVNGLTPFQGNIVLDWWFYDPAGSGKNASDFQDSISLSYYPQLPTNTDYTQPPIFGSDAIEQLAIGGADEQSGGYDQTKYQVQVVGASSAYDGPSPGAGWINTTNTRSVGWHHARIMLSPVLPDGTANASFYIDDLSHPTVTNNTVFNCGVNCLEMDAAYGNVSAYYDDITFDLAQHATLTERRSASNVVLTWPAGWTLQSTTNSTGAGFMDVAAVTSPYTNKFANVQRLFRLRSGNPPPPILHISASGKNYIVSYPQGWTLQTSTNLLVPSSFVDVPNATNPYTNAITATPQYFRLRN